MCNEPEHAIEGWKAIAAVFGVHIRTMRRRRQELLDAGAIFKIQKGTPGSNIYCAFPSLLRAWVSKKASKGEMF